ncbi:putative haloacid dehalogenase protein [Botrytis fragariae]|uniref:Putative haloacid dehalogenase protein n=1 Tax=Botrytis fragariae TaxID=1964551 RepID=A0A8H6AS33_9HELO|nr:putative haloacid dehalogenase protein [Botrytis fragariae]KAF5872602.1 putative haloacid dehalogenase protein [Botrytis fragariae]
MTLSTKPSKIRAILFDFMGTCLNWHASLLPHLPPLPSHPSYPPSLTSKIQSDFLLQWRQSYFDANTFRISHNLPVENIDFTHLSTLETLLLTPLYSPWSSSFTPPIKDSLIQAWHHQIPWPDVLPALTSLSDGNEYELFVHANGSTRLQLELVKAAGLKGVFEMLFSSQLVGVYKPERGSYEWVMRVLGLQPEECVMVAAHTSDLKGAREVGMRTVYVRRWTDDINDDQEVIKRENDAYLENMEDLEKVIREL